MENTFASPAFKGLTWHWPLIGNTRKWADTVLPVEFGLDLNLDFIRSPCSQDNSKALMTPFMSSETHVEKQEGRNKNTSTFACGFVLKTIFSATVFFFFLVEQLARNSKTYPVFFFLPGIIRLSEGFHDRYPVEDYLDLFDQTAYQIQGNLTANTSGSIQPNIIIGKWNDSQVTPVEIKLFSHNKRTESEFNGFFSGWLSASVFTLGWNITACHFHKVSHLLLLQLAKKGMKSSMALDDL